eukprot:g9462.t1
MVTEAPGSAWHRPRTAAPSGRRSLLSCVKVWALAADRYVYIPSLCLFTPCLALLLSTLEAQLGRALRTVLKVAFACAILACSWRAHEVSSFWSHGSLHLFQAILKEQPGEFHTLKDGGKLEFDQKRQNSTGQSQ